MIPKTIMAISLVMFAPVLTGQTGKPSELEAQLLQLIKKEPNISFTVEFPTRINLKELPLRGWSQSEIRAAADMGDVESAMEFACRIWSRTTEYRLFNSFLAAEWARFTELNKVLDFAVRQKRPGSLFLQSLLLSEGGVKEDVSTLPGYDEYIKAVMVGDPVLSGYHLFSSELGKPDSHEFHHSLKCMEDIFYNGLMRKTREGAIESRRKYAVYWLQRYGREPQRWRANTLFIKDALDLCAESADKGNMEAMSTWLAFFAESSFDEHSIKRIVGYTSQLLQKGYLPIYGVLMDIQPYEGKNYTRLFLRNAFSKLNWEEIDLKTSIHYRQRWPETSLNIKGDSREVSLESLSEQLPSVNRNVQDFTFRYLQRDNERTFFSEDSVKKTCALFERFGRTENPEFLLMLGDNYFTGTFISWAGEGPPHPDIWPREEEEPYPDKARELWEAALSMMEPYKRTHSISHVYNDTLLRLRKHKILMGKTGEAEKVELFEELLSWHEDPLMPFGAVSQEKHDLRYLLGYMYETGFGVPQDYGKAAYYYLLDSPEGLSNPECLNRMGILFEHGLGREKNLDEALNFYMIAEWKGSLEAGKNHARLEKLLEKESNDNRKIPTT